MWHRGTSRCTPDLRTPAELRPSAHVPLSSDRGQSPEQRCQLLGQAALGLLSRASRTQPRVRVSRVQHMEATQDTRAMTIRCDYPSTWEHLTSSAQDTASCSLQSRLTVLRCPGEAFSLEVLETPSGDPIALQTTSVSPGWCGFVGWAPSAKCKVTVLSGFSPGWGHATGNQWMFLSLFLPPIPCL